MNDNNSENWSRDNNSQFSPTAIEIRLGNEKLLKQMDEFLTGIRTINTTQEINGTPIVVAQKTYFGERKANNVGVQAILAMISSCINPSTVQGNYTEQLYFYDTDVNLKKIESTLMINRIKWGIQQDDYPAITMMLKDLFSKFGTRLIGNKERESLIPTVVSHETINQNQNQQQPGFWSNITGNKNQGG